MYQSTRGEVTDVGFEDVLIAGYCSDGGIFVPKSVPHFQVETLRTWSRLSYVDLAKKIIPFFVPEEEVSKSRLFELLDAAFSRFSNRNIVELAELSNDLKILELFHGPTLAFKDISMVCVGRLLEFFLAKKKIHSTVVVGTSGDTGSAAIEAVRGLEHVDIVVLLPRGRCTKTQELQMTTVIERNVHVFRVDGSSDELDVPIRQCFMDKDFVAQHNLASINSINWARVMVQIVNFFCAYFKVCPSCDEEVEVAIPTGACANVTAGCFAHKMGLPIKLVCTVNSNDFMVRLIEKGVYSVEGPLINSLAPAMDIQIAYNVERLLWIFSDGDSALVKKLMNQFEQMYRIQLPPEVHYKMKALISAHTVDDAGILSAMCRCWKENQYSVCPHTATAVHYHYACLSSASASDDDAKKRKRVCIATASPAKFKEAVIAAGLTPNKVPQMDELTSKPTKYEEMEKGTDWYKTLRHCIEKIAVEH